MYHPNDYENEAVPRWEFENSREDIYALVKHVQAIEKALELYAPHVSLPNTKIGEEVSFDWAWMEGRGC